MRSIRFNQEQEEELMHKHLSLSLSVASGSSLDICDMTRQQDLITALVNREKVHVASLSYPISACPQPHPAQPLPIKSNFLFQDRGHLLDLHPTADWLGSTLSSSENFC